MRRLAILFVATTALSAVGLCPPMPVPVAARRCQCRLLPLGRDRISLVSILFRSCLPLPTSARLPAWLLLVPIEHVMLAEG